MNKQTMIDEIYEEMANKELTFWCRIHRSTFNDELIFLEDREEVNNKLEYLWFDEKHREILLIDDEMQIIWHPLLIWDVLDWIQSSKGEINNSNIWTIWKQQINIMDLFKHKRLPIEQQSTECITYIHNLLPKWANMKN